MNGTNRRILSEFMVAASVCGAVAWFVVLPARERVRSLGADVRAQESRGSGTIARAITDDAAARMMREASARRTSIERRSAAVRDESVLFALVTRLADARGVRLDQMQPVAAPAQPAAPVVAAEPAAPPQPKIARAAYSLEVTGDYGAIAGLVRDLNREAGYVSVRSVRVFAADARDADKVRATIVTDHVGLAVAGADSGGRP